VRRMDLAETCSPRCDPVRVDTVRAFWWGGGISAGVGALLVGAGLWGQWGTMPGAPSSPLISVSVAPMPLPGGSGLMAIGAF
jgi:hypothetical protein